MWLWHAAYWLLIGPFKLLFRLRVSGRRNIPAEGPIILVSNHSSYLDPVLLGLACYPRPVSFMAKEELWRYPVLKHLITGLFAFPVRRATADRQAIRGALSRLSAGRIVGVFPEGKRYRSEGVGPGFPGAALIALKSKAPVVPAAILGSEQVWPDGRRFPRLARIRVAFGAPVYFDVGEERRAALETATKAVMNEIAILEKANAWK